MKVSVVIPTIGRCKHLCNTIADLLAQVPPADEIIVVDQTTFYDPEEEQKIIEIKKNVTYIHMEYPDVVRACNRGVAIARGEIIILVDDDVRITNTSFITAHCRNYTEPSIGGVAGQILHEGQTEPRPIHPRYRMDPLPWMFIRIDTGKFHDIESCVGANFSFRRTIWQELKGFDENFIHNAYRWESDFCFRLRRQGFRMIFDPKASLIHFYGKNKSGCENFKLYQQNPVATDYLIFFFRNSMYFYLKNCPFIFLPLFLKRLYREHVFNKTYLIGGFLNLGLRHYAFISGLIYGSIAWLKVYSHEYRSPNSNYS